MTENQNNTQNSNDFMAEKIIKIMIKKTHIILLSGLIAALIVLIAVSIFVTPEYQSHTSFYIYNTSNSYDSGTISNSDLQAAENLAVTYSKILGSNTVFDSVIDNLNYKKELSRKELRDIIKVDVTSDKQLIEVSVASSDPKLSYEIAEAFVRIAPKEIVRIAKGGGVEVVDQPEISTEKTSPKTFYNTFIGFIVGIFIACAILFIKIICDKTIYSFEDISEKTDLTVIGQIPEITPPNNYRFWSLREGGLIYYDDAKEKG